MSFANAKLLRHPLLLLAFGFMLQMCASNGGENTPTTATSSTTGGTPDGGACSVDGDCALPPSRCSDDGTGLVYYANPSCTNGACSWSEQRILCACYNGGCVGTGTSGGISGVSSSATLTLYNTAGPMGGGGLGGWGGLSGSGGLGDLDASYDAESSVADAADADAALQACNSPNDCTLPPSYCLDSNTLVFAQLATCNAHLCSFTFSQMACPCSGNGCISTTTK
jgi:hypothetical protein